MIETKTNIDSAVKHLSWRIQQQKIMPNEKDRECFNVILETLNQNYNSTTMQDVLFAKLLIDKLLMLTLTGERSMANAIHVVKEILEVPLTDMGQQFQMMVPMIRLSRALEEKFIKLPMTDDERANAASVAKAKAQLMENHKEELKTEFLKPYSAEEFNFFIKRLVFELSNEFQNRP